MRMSVRVISLKFMLHSSLVEPRPVPTYQSRAPAAAKDSSRTLLPDPLDAMRTPHRKAPKQLGSEQLPTELAAPDIVHKVTARLPSMTGDPLDFLTEEQMLADEGAIDDAMGGAENLG
jgi:hypothetical protein